jgi:hypothetical protein
MTRLFRSIVVVLLLLLLAGMVYGGGTSQEEPEKITLSHQSWYYGDENIGPILDWVS